MKSQKTNLSKNQILESIKKAYSMEDSKTNTLNKHNRCMLPEPELMERLFNTDKHINSHGNSTKIKDFYTFSMMYNAVASATLKHRLDEDYSVISPKFMSIGKHSRKNGVNSANLFRDDLFIIAQRGYKDIENEKFAYGAKIDIVLDPSEISYVYGNIEKIALLLKNWSDAVKSKDKKEIKRAKKKYLSYYNRKSKESKKKTIEDIIEIQIAKNDTTVDKLYSLQCVGLRKHTKDLLKKYNLKYEKNKAFNACHNNKREIRSLKRQILSLRDILENTTKNDEYIYYSNTKDTGREYSNLSFLPKVVRKELFIERLGLTEYDLPSASQRILYRLFGDKFDLKGLRFVANKDHYQIVDDLFTVNGKIEKRKRLEFTINEKTVYKNYEECKTDLKQVIQAYTFGASRIQSGCQYLRLNKLFCTLETSIKSEIKLLCEFLKDNTKMKELLESNEVLNFSDVEFDDEKTRLAKVFQSVETIVINGMKKNLFSDYKETDMFRLHDAIYIKTQSDKKKVSTKRFNTEFDNILSDLRDNTTINVF